MIPPSIIRRALGLHEGGSPRIQTDVVLEAEMVAHDGERIDGKKFEPISTVV
jgi:hypothetical protein